jgi:hypothetical protein
VDICDFTMRPLYPLTLPSLGIVKVLMQNLYLRITALGRLEQQFLK